MILDNNVYFIESKNIKVFPCAYRGQNSKGETYNIESKLSTERNLTNFGKADTYIESFKADSLTVYIKGYRFEITSTGLKAFLTDNSLHVIGIRLIDQAITADAKDTTKRLGSFHKISDSANNTVYDSALDTTINTADCFTGLVFATETALESTDYTDAIKILEDANGMGRDKSGGYLPKTQSNSNIGDFMTAIDPTFSGVKGEDILTSNSLIKDEKFTDLGNYKDYFSSRLSTPFYGAGTDYSVVLGGKSAAGLIGSSAFAAGTGNFAIKTNSAAFGLNNAVAGENSLVSGKANFEYGLNNLVSGNNNCVNGSNNIISGTENSILGNNCFVSGVTNKIESNVNNSMLFGGYNVASAAGTVAFGKGLIVNNNTKAAFGNFNKGTCLFEIGNGASDTDRKTIFSVDAYGNVNSAANIAAAGNISLGNTLTVGTDTKFNNINNAVKGSLTVNKTADDELDFTIGEKTIYNLKYDGTSSRTRLNGGLAYGGNSIAIGKYSSAIGRNAIAIGSDEFNSTTHTDVTTLFNNPEIQATLAKAIDAEYGVTISNIKSIIYEKGTSSLYKVG